MLDYKRISKLTKLYSQPHRKYHNLHHITSMLNELHNNAFIRETLSADELRNLYYAIWYHDAIFDLEKSEVSNEVKSSDFFLKDQFKQIPVQDIEMISEAILATEFHFTEKNFDGNPITNILLDLDILTFAAEYRKFQQCNNNIFEEYANAYSKEEVFEGRRKFLFSILEKNSLTFRAFPNKVEMTEKAYTNINRYVKEMFNGKPKS